MSDEKPRATLSDKQARGGVIGGKGYGFQAAYIVSRIPDWLEDPDFAQFLQEGAGDVDVRFNRDDGEERWYVQVKNHEVKMAEAREVLAQFCDTDAGSPGTYTRFTLACPGLHADLKRLRAAVGELRGAKDFYRPGQDEILDNTWADLESLVGKLELQVDAAFLVDKVDFDTDLAGLTDDASLCDLFVGRLLKLEPWARATRKGAARAYEKLALLSHRAIRQTCSREQVEALIREAVGALPAGESLFETQSVTRTEGVEQPGVILRLNFDHLIETHTRLFAGRESYLQAIFDFIKTNPSGYIFVEALSGYGKTSLLAKLAQDNPHFAYHFISQAYKSYGSDFAPTEMESLLLNLCEQLETGNGRSNKHLSPKARFHSLLRSSPGNGPRVVVIDAVDEVNQHPNYLLGLLPASLPPGVFMILSARELGDRDYLSEVGLRRSDIGMFIDLPGLDETAIAELLTMVGGKALSLAASQSFVKKLYRVSNGDPFYLRFLVEDVAQGIIIPQNIARTPSGLNEYLDIQLSILDRSAHLPQQRDILGLILEAHGPLSRRDLINMVDGLDGLNFDNAIRDIHRFLLVYNDMYTFCHNRFKEYFASKVL